MSIYRSVAVACAAVCLCSFSAVTADSIKIGYPMPLSGPASVYGIPVTKGAELAVKEINEKGGLLGRKVELLERDSKASADEAVRLARELIAPTSKTVQLTATKNLHPYIFRMASNTDIDGSSGAAINSRCEAGSASAFLAATVSAKRRRCAR